MSVSSETANIECVKNIYAAFGRGDVPSILEALHPDIDWEAGAQPTRVAIPWIRPGRGREAVVAFFEALRDTLRFEAFEVLAVMGAGEWVVGLVRLEAVHLGTGRRVIENSEAHIWRFVPHGRIVAMRHGADSLHQAEVAGLL